MAKRVRLYADSLDEFISQVEYELDKYRADCEHPHDVWLEFNDDEVHLVHLNVVVKRFENPYNGDIWDVR